ncbi:MAG TPA: RES family NAD+ phosphorylase [Terriglobales bacterium]|nr:RES family NAD+ phosphorylase [Terriglobales bacterium]
MTFTAWRITKRKHAKSAFSGLAAKKYGGRWNSPGTAVVYAAQSRSLAVLEVLVHLESSDLLKKYVLIGMEIDDSFVAEIDRRVLPHTWQVDPAPVEMRLIGDQWAADATSAVLKVPSAIVPGEDNFLLNPMHPDFTKLRLGKPVDFQFDPRLSR